MNLAKHLLELEEKMPGNCPPSFFSWFCKHELCALCVPDLQGSKIIQQCLIEENALLSF